jgi:hypothetical protein
MAKGRKGIWGTYDDFFLGDVELTSDGSPGSFDGGDGVRERAVPEEGRGGWEVRVEGKLQAEKAGRAAYRSKRAALALKVEVFMADILVVLKRFD